MIKTETIHKIYAGWLGKMIGVRLGSPIEGWTYEQIHHVYGEIYGYLKDCKRFGSDDDTTVPLFLLRALEDSGFHLTPQAVGDALLNYSPYERGFFWWGGYGVSTEHTAYLNLRHGIQAPLSGSVEHNGRAVAEQIGGQIFIDVWGLVCPGNPDLAAEYAQMAASVTHGGNGIYGGMFVAACIAYAFCDNHIRGMIEKGLTYIPGDCEYAKAVRAVMVYHDEHPESWQDCYQYIYSNFGYDKYPGACHIIPNICVMILALLYGGGDFTQTLCIGAMCGWDTDCNVGNLGAIMGVMVGLERIDYARWIQPVNDFLATASVIGSLNHMDIPYGASYMAKLASTVSGSKLPPPWDMITSGRIDSCHFEYPGSTHAMEVRLENAACDAILFNSDEAAYTGSRSLKVHVPLPRHAKESVYIFSRTSLSPEDFTGTFNYGSGFSPRLYPGQTIHGSVMIPSYGSDCAVCLYARDAVSGEVFTGESFIPAKGEWLQLTYKVPDADTISEAGFAFKMTGPTRQPESLICFIDDLYFDGNPDYSINFACIKEEHWGGLQREIRQFTKLKGLSFKEDGALHLSCSDFAQMYTGRYDWKDYTAGFELRPVLGMDHFVLVRVQGAMRSYAAGFSGDKLCLQKNEHGVCRTLCETDFSWKPGRTYALTVKVLGNQLTVWADGIEMLRWTDTHHPYLTGGVGLSVRNGSRCGYLSLTVR